MIRVLVVDDERLVRAGFRMIIDAEPGMTVVGEAADGRAAIDQARRLRPDVVVMDVRMPQVDGIAATAQLVGERVAGDGTGPRIIVVTTFDLDEYVFGALRAGASGFLLKDAPETQLLAAIRVAADGGSMFSPSATRRLIGVFARRGDPAARASLEQLTPRELDVLRRIAAGRSNREIAEELSVTEHTAKTHVAHILGKLDLRDRIQAAILALEVGLDDGEPPAG